MEISSSTLPAVAAERATMFVALELSKSSWLVALHSPVADKVSLHRFVGGDVAGLLALIARKQTQAEARLVTNPPRPSRQHSARRQFTRPSKQWHFRYPRCGACKRSVVDGGSYSTGRSKHLSPSKC